MYLDVKNDVGFTFDGAVNWHIKDEFYKEMSRKSVVVSVYVCCVTHTLCSSTRKTCMCPVLTQVYELSLSAHLVTKKQLHMQGYRRLVGLIDLFPQLLIGILK